MLPSEAGDTRAFARTQPGPRPAVLVSWARVVSFWDAGVAGGDPQQAQQALAGSVQSFARNARLAIQDVERFSLPL